MERCTRFIPILGYTALRFNTYSFPTVNIFYRCRIAYERSDIYCICALNVCNIVYNGLFGISNSLISFFYCLDVFNINIVQCLNVFVTQSFCNLITLSYDSLKGI